MQKKCLHGFLCSLCCCVVLFGSLLVLGGCGKHEARGGTAGTIVGASIGAVVAKNPLDGVLFGGAIGNLVGRVAGAEDDKEEQEERHERHVQALQSENRSLRRAAEQWCGTCLQRVSLRGARRCPSCGDELISEKLCRRCHAKFEPNTGYRYCPFCKDRTLLTSR